MDRRQFTWLALGAAGVAVVGARSGQRLLASGATEATFFDPRFHGARERALELASGGAVRAIAADATDLALWFQSRASGRSPTYIQGVTPELAPFCLRQFVPHAQLSIRRIDRDLFAWAIRLPG
jgi:hypothetical protein